MVYYTSAISGSTIYIHILEDKEMSLLFLEDTESKPCKSFSCFFHRGFNTFFMLNSAEHEIYPAHKC